MYLFVILAKNKQVFLPEDSILTCLPSSGDG